MQIISVINYKGGVGKTTVTANLAAELAYRGKRVLLLDMDAQASLTFSFVAPDYWEENLEKEKTIKNWFDSVSKNETTTPLSKLIIELPDPWITGGNGAVDLISSHLGLINVDLELATLLGGASLQQAKSNYIKVHGKLREEIKKVASDKYDIVLIDCPPNFNIVTKNALVASDKLLIPAKPDYLSTLGIDYLHRQVNELVSTFNEFASMSPEITETTPKILGVVFTMVQFHSGEPISAQEQYIRQIGRQRSNIPVFKTMFRENKSLYAISPERGRPVVSGSRYGGTPTVKTVVSEIKEFVNEFMAQTGI